MPVEGRGQQSARIFSGKTLRPPRRVSFSTKLKVLAQRARRIRNEPLRTLAHLIDKEWLLESWKRIRKGAAYGVDKVSAEEYQKNLDYNLDDLLRRLKANKYRPMPVKRVYIPKADGRKRPLGLPTIEDKIVQRAVGMILSAIYEQDFLSMSFGFRQGRSAHQAIEYAKAAITQGKVSWVVDADISKFFDEVDHQWLMRFLKHRIADKSILRLIGRWLKAGVMEEGKITKASTGTPQGGVISPILANVYLHYVTDLWADRVVAKHIRGKIYSVRYADDVLFCFQHRNDAVRFLKALHLRLEKFGLKLNSAKTKLVRFGRFAERDRKIRGERRATFGFLGFTFYNRKSRTGKYTVGCRTQSGRLSGSMNRVTAWCKDNRHQNIEWQARYLNAVLRGHYNYYGVTGNFKSVAAFYRHTLRVWHRYLSRRSQRGYIRWDKFVRVLKTHPLVKPYLPHSKCQQQMTMM
jgi:group II intron reverse transcriptase/maturase